MPRSNNWRTALVGSNDGQTIYFLVGTRGIDFKLYDHIRQAIIDERGRLYTDGGVTVRNYYKGSDVDIHELILEIARRFVSNEPIDGAFMSGHGMSWKQQRDEYYRNHPVHGLKLERVDLYDQLSPGDGLDAYLSDGVWIRPDGTLTEK